MSSTMDQRTANLVALIKTITVSALSILAVVSIVALAWVHDGSYAQVAQSALPQVLFGAGGLLVAMHAVDSISSAFVQKASTTASAQVQIAASAASNGAPEPTPEPAAPEPVASEPAAPAPDGGPLIGN